VLAFLGVRGCSLTPKVAHPAAAHGEEERRRPASDEEMTAAGGCLYLCARVCWVMQP